MMYKHKKFKFRKTVFAGAMAASFLVTGVSGFAEEIKSRNISDGFVTIEGELIRGADNAPVTLLVTSSDIDFLDETAWLSIDGDDVAYYKEASLTSDKTYSFKFKLEEPGIYNVYIASKSSGVEKSQIIYIDEEMNDALISAMLEAMDAEILKSIVAENLKNLGVFAFEGDAFDSDAAELLFDAIKDEDNLKADDVVLLIEKAILSAEINNDKLKSFYDYPKMTFLDDKIFDYCTEDLAEDVADAMSKSGISSLSDFDEAIVKATVLELANTNDGVLPLKEALKAYKDELLIEKTITTSMCESLIEASDYSDYDELAEAIEDYKEASSSGGGGGSGSGGGSKNKVDIGSIANALPAGNSQGNNVVPAEISPFDDIDSVPWAKEAIMKLYKDKVINGKTENLFYPQDNVTRAEFVKILMLAFDVKLVDEECPFVDVSENEWSYQYIKTAYLAGVVNGIDDVTFGKNMNITRQDLCTMVYRLLKTGNPEFEALDINSSFNDAEEISAYAKEAVGFMQKNGIISGDDNKNFNPKSPATRAEAVKIVYNAMNLYEKN